MTPAEMARIHAAAMTDSRPWTAQEISAMLAQPGCLAFSNGPSFALVRFAADETELLTIATHPYRQNQGLASTLVQHWLEAAKRRDMASAFLEVAADNAPALRLYLSQGFRKSGTRRGYYERQGAPSADAVVMERRLTLGHDSDPAISE